MSSSTFRTPKKLFKLILILVFILTLTSWSTSIYFSTKTQSSISVNKENIIPAPFELSKTTDFSYSTIWNKVYWIQKRQYNLNIENNKPEQSFLQQLQSYEVSGHNTEELNKLLNQLPPQTINSNNTITTIIHITNKQFTEKQLNSLLAQTMSIKEIWIICSSDLYTIIESYANKYRSNNLNILLFLDKDYKKKATSYPTHSAGATTWMHYLPQVQTDYIWILEDGIIPSNDYLKTIYQLLQTDQYKDVLLGSHASLLPSNIYNNNNNKDQSMTSSIHCLPFSFHFLPKVTQHVDMIHHSWFLRSSWVPYLLMDKRYDALASPLAYYISQSLYLYANIPSIVIPPIDLASSSLSASSSSSSLNTTPLLSIKKLSNVVSCNSITEIYRHSASWKRILGLRANPTAYDHRLRTLMTSDESSSALFFIHGLLEAKSLFPLICQFHPSVPIHVVVTGKKNKGLSGDMLSTILSESNCTSNTIIHDLDIHTVINPLALTNHISRSLSPIIQALQPRLFIHLKDNVQLFNSLDTMAKIHHLTSIQLYSKDVQHALWITKLPLEALQYWNRIDINLIAITDRRPHSLSRLLNSLNHATYFDDKVDITIHMEQSADRVTKMFVNSFNWKYGLKSVRHRIHKGGLMPAIIESWYPSDNHSYGVLLEDDIEVSPLFYAWIKYNILHYRYSIKNSKNSQWIYGVSLYSPRNLELLPDGRKEFDPNDVLLPLFPQRTPYASQVPCSWGAVYFPEHWREFHQYLTSRLLDLKSSSPRLKITVPKSRSSRWKKSWKKYFIEMVYLRAYVMIYPNFQDFESFSTNHLEFGTHIKHERAQVAINSFVVPLMQRDTIMDQLPHHRLPDFKDLPFMDLWGNLKTHKELDMIGEDWHRHVSSCVRQPGKFNSQDLLCPLHYRGNSTINKINQLKSKPIITKQQQEEETAVAEASIAGIETNNQQKSLNEDHSINMDDDKVNSNKDLVDIELLDELAISLDVAKMTTMASDHEYEDDEMKDLEANWQALTYLGKQLQYHS